MLLNKASVMCYSKRQNTAETSTFGSEIVAMNQAVEMLKGLKYKLWLFGNEMIENKTKSFGNKNSVVMNSSVLK